ncbi:endonuclease/exonuclease/phosphatase family protein [Wenzhouxiangella limi]|uniref:Nuclease n=1 Tax=Wenzhouxiangella limi TaxID=2707351 RepID=A0A845VF62_9GAMM|nr:endonuclease/exonuclease/phosphatase family protein [Wenzhouxiangella limi]NDY95869.1 nuclease [Wenzhouxiangella limi]
MRILSTLLIGFLLAASLSAQTLSIPEIHGDGHVPTVPNREITTQGIVTLVLEDRFWVQAPDIDRRAGLAVLTEGRPSVGRGDRVALRGRIEHYLPDNRPTDLPVTRMVQPNIEVIARDQPVPAAVLIGPDGVQIPASLAPAAFDAPLKPEDNAIDFWTALMGMRVSLQTNRVVGPTSRFQETWVVAGNNHRNLGRFGTVAAQPDDFNPDRILVQPNPLLLPTFPDPATVGDRFAAVTGVVDYRFGNFRVVAEHALRRLPEPQTAISSRLSGDSDHLLVASYNVENLNPVIEDFSAVRTPRDVDDAIGSGRMDELARHIAEILNAPDIIGLQEIQDGNGAEDSDLVSADRTLAALTTAITEAGGPSYAWLDLPPERNADGGQPGGNIRNVFLYNPARVELVTDSARRLGGPAFANSRKSLVAEFVFNGHRLVVINNHFASKGGSDPLFGQRQPPVEGDAEQRQAQARAVLDFAAGLNTDRRDRLVVLGDLNDHWFSEPLSILTGDKTVPLHNPVTDLPSRERFTYIFQGNAQAIDHILVSQALKPATELALIPINSLNPRQAADHDPLVVKLHLPES